MAVVLMVSLCGMAFLPGISKRRCKALQTRCVSNLKHVGLALQLYAEANQDTLPGPVFPVARAAYDETSKHELSRYIAETLGCPKPSTKTSVVRELLCPAYHLHGSEPDSVAAVRTYALNENVSRKRGSRAPPFGCVGPVPSEPLKRSALATYGPPSSLFATTDADKGTVSPKAAYWMDVPYRPVHGKTRNRLFFDGHVEVR